MENNTPPGRAVWQAARAYIEKYGDRITYTKEAYVYAQLREFRYTCQATDIIEMEVYTLCLAFLQEGKKHPRRNVRKTTRQLVAFCGTQLNHLFAYVPVPALEPIESRQRAAWYRVLRLCCPGDFINPPEKKLKYLLTIP